jgi:hypothetical protein
MTGASCACGCGEPVPYAGAKTSACAARAVAEWVVHRDERRSVVRKLTKKQQTEVERARSARRGWYSAAGEVPPDDAA